MADYIERKVVKELLNINYGGYLDAIDRIPAADVVPVVHGRFVHDGPRFAGGVDWWHCSNCGGLASGVETRFDYCPWCGAKMDEGKNDAPN